jgi:hypothetical protein
LRLKNTIIKQKMNKIWKKYAKNSEKWSFLLFILLYNQKKYIIIKMNLKNNKKGEIAYVLQSPAEKEEEQ